MLIPNWEKHTISLSKYQSHIDENECVMLKEEFLDILKGDSLVLHKEVRV